MLLVSALLVVLTASLERKLLAQISWPVLLLTMAMLSAIPPAAILLATPGRGLTWPEHALVAWIASRGIVAAAVAGVAGAQLASNRYQGGQVVMHAVFALIAATMVLHGFSLGPLARQLKLTLGDKPSLAVVGASAWTLDLAATLARAGASVLLIDTFPGAFEN